MVSWSTFLLLLPLVSASTLEHRATTACGKFDRANVGSYSLLANHWGESGAASGWQCSTLESVNGNSVSWNTHWTWTGGTGIKSFSNVQLNNGINRQLSAINSMPSTWKWSQTNTGTVVANVAYDLFTSWTAGGSSVNEIMIWLANFGAKPISYKYVSNKAVPIASNVNIAGHTWNLYLGTNGQNEVYSFLPAGGNVITSFSGDIHGFFTHLINEGHIPSSQYLVTAQAGTEATSGTATLETSVYSLSID